MIWKIRIKTKIIKILNHYQMSKPWNITINLNKIKIKILNNMLMNKKNNWLKINPQKTKTNQLKYKMRNPMKITFQYKKMGKLIRTIRSIHKWVPKAKMKIVWIVTSNQSIMNKNRGNKVLAEVALIAIKRVRYTPTAKQRKSNWVQRI